MVEDKFPSSHPVPVWVTPRKSGNLELCKEANRFLTKDKRRLPNETFTLCFLSTAPSCPSSHCKTRNEANVRVGTLCTVECCSVASPQGTTNCLEDPAVHARTGFCSSLQRAISFVDTLTSDFLFPSDAGIQPSPSDLFKMQNCKIRTEACTSAA